MILYFSATGNSKYVASCIAEATHDEIRSITDCITDNSFVFKDDRIGIVTPTYFWGLPSVVNDFLKNVEFHTDYLYFIATYGTTPGAIGALTKEAIRNRDIDAYYSVRMVDTYTPIFDISTKERQRKFTQNTEQPIVKILINNAGYERSGAFSSMQEKDILNMISVNIKGMTMMQRVCLPYMQAGSFSVITCSVSAFVPVPNQTVYAASKKYVYYLGKALREELLTKNINVLLLCPGNMDTEMNPRGQGRQSQKINGLPFLNMDKLTWKALELAEKGKGVYTPGWFYKGYRIAAKLIPSAWMLKIVKNYY